MPSRLLLAFVTVMLIASSTPAAPELVPLDATDPAASPLTATSGGWRADGLTLTLEVGALQHETLTLDGKQWTALTLTEGTVQGDAGAPGLPVWTGLVIVPDGAVVEIRSAAAAARVVEDIDLMPVQPDDATAFVIDDDAYSGTAPAPATMASLGAPARLAGVAVAPLTIRPVGYDPATRSVTVASRVTVELTWPAAASASPDRDLPPSMRRLLADLAVNGDPFRDDPAADQTPGTWLALCPDIQSVADAIEPLAQWRRRQGYNVIVADLGEAGPTTVAIKNWLTGVYETVDPPLEHVVLVGDAAASTIQVPTWNEVVSGYYGEGDFYYTQLDGNDILPDVHIGRLSCSSVSELEGIVAKIVAYERQPPVTDPEWFNRALIVGDPSSSGITTVYVGQWLAAQLDPLGYEVTEVYSGNFASQMFSGLNQGQALFAYRGFGGMSGFTTGHIGALANGGAQSFACFPTCNTGGFRAETNCRSEAFLRNPGGGAVGAIATATGGTHTRYNNCFYQGTWEGMVNGSDHHQGVALTRGKLELYRNYHEPEPEVVEVWSVWNNLMGDPATDIWLSEPASLVVDHPAVLPAASGALPVQVTTGGVGVVGACVTVVQNETLLAVAYTEASGAITVPLTGLVDGPLDVTVSGHDLRPYRGTAIVGDQPVWVALDGWTVDDPAGDQDGLANPGEPVTIDLVLTNLGTSTATGMAATVTSESPWLEVIQPTASFGTIGAGLSATGDQPIGVAVHAAAPDQAPGRLRVTATGSDGSWVSILDVAIVGSDPQPAGWMYSEGLPEPGSSGDLSLILDNVGGRDCAGAQAVLRSWSPWVEVVDSLGTWGTLPAGSSADNTADPFGVDIAAGCVRGHLAAFTVYLDELDGSERRVDFTMPVGRAAAGEPAGPDRYGYYAFDDTDTDYAHAPTYDWVELDPSFGGPGTDVGLTDFGYEQDDTETVDLPFTFSYYGVDHDRLSICSNGWIAFGETTLRHYRNWTIPSAGSPDAMVAVFWDDLKQADTNRVYHWHDAANQRYIVQWSRMTNIFGGVQNCQVILYDPQSHPTANGDGRIVCQYERVQNNDVSRGYASVGIQNHDRTDGVLYTYYSDYAPGAEPLQSGRAIAFVPAGFQSLATCEVSPAELAFAVPAGGHQTRSLHIANNGPAGSALSFAVSRRDPDVLVGDKNLEGSTVTVAPDGYIPGATTSLDIAVFNGSPDTEWIVEVTLDLPLGVSLETATDLVSTSGTLAWQGATGDGVTVVWTSNLTEVITEGLTGVATIEITTEEGLGDIQIPWTMRGDNFGSPPHTLVGTLELVSLAETVRVISPNGGQVWSLGETHDLTWYATPDIENLSIELSRDSGANWEILADSVPALPAVYTWTVSGTTSGNCLVRMASVADPEINDTSDGSFIIQRDLGWLSLDTWSGTVVPGSSVTLEITADAADLPDGVHVQHLVITSNAGDPIIVPITFAVGEGAPVTDLPQAVTLAQNHPNPFNPATTIDFALPAAAVVDLAVYDLTGRRVAHLVSGSRPAGHHSVVWRATDQTGRRLSSGTYIYRLQTGATTESRKLTVVK